MAIKKQHKIDNKVTITLIQKNFKRLGVDNKLVLKDLLRNSLPQNTAEKTTKTV
jgi:hypothetical protein